MSAARVERRQRLWVLLAAMLAGPLLAEGVLRWCLFGTSSLAREWGRPLRNPGLFAREYCDERFWKLRLLFDPDLQANYEANLVLDPLLGWRNEWVVPPHFVHPLADKLGHRRPVVFYGASFVQPELAVQLHQGALDPRFGLLTYGVNAWDMGQCWLLMGASLAHFAGRAPLVLLGFQLESDLDRATLGFRNAAKPRFSLDPAGAIAVEPCVPAYAREHMLEHPVGIRSYLWAWLRGPSSPFGAARARNRAQQTAELERAFDLHLALFLDMRERVRELGGEFRMVIYHESDALRPGSVQPDRERRLLAFLEQESIPYMNTRKLFDAAQQSGLDLDQLYFPADNPAGGHPNNQGQRWIGLALERFIDGHADRLNAPKNPYLELFENR